ncbi:MAG TPA: hypothetical protein VGP93_00435 [Polyangiaceae bacterium]|jgi:hypothetical protein|nr:hypothetical protein [Polyangiaceae bacterium]
MSPQQLSGISRLGALVGMLLLAAAGSCARSGLNPGDLSLEDPEADAGSEPLPATPDDAGSDVSSETPSVPSAEPSLPPSCEPRDEECNGVDDDCNGAVDDLTPIPCPGGGARYCVAGALSACPERCEVCLPGSERVCFHSFCTFWGVQSCAADGRSFGACREQEPPAECASIARSKKDSPELEQCCIDNGYCCLDSHDLDQDGNKSELIGVCDEVSCQ